jgi:hypothetical protein
MHRSKSPWFVAAVLSAVCVAKDAVWDGRSVPITVQVLKAVPVRSAQSLGGERMARGTLYARQDLLIASGARFKVVSLDGEGTCTIEYLGQRHSLLNCPWMPGYTDPQSDIFKVVEVGERNQK